MPRPTLILSTSEGMLDHDPGHEVRGEHPERPARLATLLDRFREAPAATSARWTLDTTAPESSRDVLEYVHDPAHVDRVLAARGRSLQLDPDTGTSPGSVDAALRAVAHATYGVRRVLDDSPARQAFALVRPPGHHARPDRAMGFCLFNNLAIAVEIARREFEVERVLVVDWDVHHGNGTQAAFWDRADVLVVDVHQAPHYPGTGALTEIGDGEGRGYTINLPVPAGLGDEDYLSLFRRVLIPVAGAFDPDLVVVAAGFDAHVADPLGDMRLSSDGFRRLAELVRAIADRHAGGRLLATLEGGYALDALADSVWACANAFGRDEDSHPGPRSDAGEPNPEAPLHPAVADLVEAAMRVHGRRWPFETR